MDGERIRALYYPINEADWFILETDRSTYELRLGGYKKSEPTDLSNLLPVREYPKDVLIAEVLTDDDSLWIRLSTDECIIHGFTSIASNGELSAQVRFEHFGGQTKSHLDGLRRV